MDKVNKPWSEKYRPQNISNIISHDRIKNTIYNFLKNNNLPNLLFYGKAGLGKTSLILAFIKEYYNNDYDNYVININASEERGVQTIRDKIEPFCKLLYNDTKYKLIILDEVDSMTIEAQNILRKIVEKYIHKVRFCFICNYIKQIILPLQSRFIIFKFNPLTKDYLMNYLETIFIKENFYITKNSLQIIYKYCKGDLRKMLNILNSLNIYKNDVIKVNDIRKLILYPSKKNIINIFKYVKNNDLNNSIINISNYIKINDLLINEIIIEMYDILIDFIINNDYNIFNKNKIINIIKKLSIINRNIYNNTNNNIISLISIFYL